MWFCFTTWETVVHEVQKLDITQERLVVEGSGALVESQITEMHDEVRAKEVEKDIPLQLHRILRIRIGLLVDLCKLETQAAVRNETQSL